MVDKIHYYTEAQDGTGEVVSLCFVKENANIDFNDDDALLQVYLQAAIKKIEDVTGQTLSKQNLVANIPYFRTGIFEPSRFVQIDRFPFNEITLFEVWDGEEWVEFTDYTIENRNADYPRILADWNSIIPWEVYSDQPYPVRVTASIGYDPDDVPDTLKVAIAQFVAMLYDSRGDCSCESNGLPGAVNILISSEMIGYYFG